MENIKSENVNVNLKVNVVSSQFYVSPTILVEMLVNNWKKKIKLPANYTQATFNNGLKLKCKYFLKEILFI